MTSVRGRGRPVHKGQAFKALTGPPSSNRDHKNPLGQTNRAPLKLLRDLLKLLLDPFRLLLFPTFPRILALIATANRTWIKSSKHSSRIQRLDLETNSRPKPRTSIAVGPTWSAITSANNVKTILLPVELPDPTKFRLRPPFSGIESTSTGSSISGS